MASIKDIVNLTGLSHGTVSNVLNGKGNVSVEKIKLVEEAIRKLDYSPDARAKTLRRGSSRSVALILPDIINPKYADIFMAVDEFFKETDYTVQLFVTKDFPSREREIIDRIIAQRVNGAILVSCQVDTASAYDKLQGNDIKLVFLERKPLIDANYLGFNYEEAGGEIGLLAATSGSKYAGILSGPSSYSCDCEFCKGFEDAFHRGNDRPIQKVNIKEERGMACRSVFSFFKDNVELDAIAASSLIFASGVMSAYKLGSKQNVPSVFALAPQNILEQNDGILKFEMNYRELGVEAGRVLMSSLKNPALAPAKKILSSAGLKHRVELSGNAPSRQRINVLTLDSPATTALLKLSPAFTKATGIEVNFAVFQYHDLYQTIRQIGYTDIYDVIRLDMVWLPWLKDAYFLDLSKNFPAISHVFENMIPEILPDFSLVSGVPYAVPFDLSIQLLFYRRDLFEDPKIKRLFFERTRRELVVPRTFEEYNEVAAFFTRTVNPDSPIEFGTTFTPGTTSSIVGEYLPRLFGMGGCLFDADGGPQLDSSEAIQALRNYRESQAFACPIPENSWWDASVKNFMDGKIAMMIMFLNHASNINNPQLSQVAGKVGFATVPGNSPLLGGGSLAIPKNTQKRDAAFSFIEWACGQELSSAFTLLGGVSPCTKPYSDFELLDMYPWLSTVHQNLKRGYRRKMIEVGGSQIEEYQFEQILGVALKNTLIGIVTPEESLAYAQRGVIELIRQCDARKQS